MQAENIDRLEKKVAVLTRLIEVNNVLTTALLSEGPRLQSLLNYLMNAAAEITDAESASVLLWNANTHELFFVATTTSQPAAQDLIGKPVPLDSIAGTILQERKLVQVDDITADPRHYAALDEEIEFETRSLLGVPLIAKGVPIGVLEVVNKKTLPWTEDDRSNLTVMANGAAVAIDVARMVNKIQQANEELSQLDKMKNDFIAIASHELRTPLGIILGYASFLEESQDADTSGLASKVMNSALQLRHIIEDMINLRYLKQNPSDLQREPLTLDDLLKDLTRDVRLATDAQDHNLSVICTDKTTQVSVDRTRIVMALTNIVNNAISFTPKGGKITIEAEVRNSREAWIRVTDNGIGLEKDKLERIFEEFYQVEEHMTRRHGGLGIGLSISRALVKAHGGRVWAESDGLGTGATFTVSLPLAQS